MHKTVFPALIGAAFSLMLLGTAHAQNARTWISSTGSDGGGCGPIATPCRTLQHAHDVTNANGEVDVKDSAGYGSVVITKAISIIGDGTISGVLGPAGGNAITINAGLADSVILRGLTIEGSGTAAIGVAFNSGGSLTISDCTVQNFVGSSDPNGTGIYLKPATGTPTFTITNTKISNNSDVGLYIFSTAEASLTVDHVVANNNQYGVVVDTFSQQGGATQATISNSLATNNSVFGFYFLAATGNGITQISSIVRSQTLQNGANNGVNVQVDGPVFGYISGSTFIGTSNGLVLKNPSNNFFFLSLGDNLISNAPLGLQKASYN